MTLFPFNLSSHFQPNEYRSRHAHSTFRPVEWWKIARKRAKNLFLPSFSQSAITICASCFPDWNLHQTSKSPPEWHPFFFIRTILNLLQLSSDQQSRLYHFPHHSGGERLKNTKTPQTRSNRTSRRVTKLQQHTNRWKISNRITLLSLPLNFPQTSQYFTMNSHYGRTINDEKLL